MSNLGETADQILEQLKRKEKTDIGKLKKEVPTTDTSILDFMNEWGLIELENGEVKITNFGLELIAIK